MNIPHTRRYEMLVRVSDFGDAHPDIFPPESLGGQMFAAVRAAAKALGQHAAAQMSSRGAAAEALRTKIASRARLRTALDAIRRTARAIAIDTPGVESKFHLPGWVGEPALIAAARAFAADAHSISAALLAHGLPTTFLDDLDATIVAFEAAIRDHAAGRAAEATARTGLGVALVEGLTAVQRLDAIVPNLLRENPTTYAGWERVRHVERPPRARNSARKPPQPPVPQAPAASNPPETASVAPPAAGTPTVG
jgi:hypothetical protein